MESDMTFWLEDGQQIQVGDNKAGTVPVWVLIALFGTAALLWIARLMWVASTHIIEDISLRGVMLGVLFVVVVCKMVNPFTLKRS
jgi:hypothetical protein